MQRKRVDLVLVERGLFDSRAKAKAAIEAGGVRVAGQTLARASDLVDPQADIEAVAAHPFVGRGALKLDHALRLWPIAVEGRVALDVGASTGGFSQDCLLHGARRVYAVDVGQGQLHPSLASDPRVINLEHTDARKLGPALVPEPLQLIVCDASFIGLAKVLPAALGLAMQGADLVALIKPQFEVGPQGVGKGGLVKDAGLREAAATAVQDWLEAQGWRVQARTLSPISGSDGNIEYLVWARKAQNPSS